MAEKNDFDQIRKTQRSGSDEEPGRRSGGGLEFTFPGKPERKAGEKLFSENKTGDEKETDLTTTGERDSK